MFSPQYRITNSLASNMRKVGELIGEFNASAFSGTVLMNMERDARALSAFSSTHIEGNTLPLTDVKKIIKSQPERLRDTEREVVNYNNALVMLDEKIGANENITISHEFITHIHSIVIDGLMPSAYMGSYRSDPVFVNDPVKKQTIYLPPDAKDVNPLMSDLVDFIDAQQNVIDPLIIAGLFHKQSVVIHPFMDGNGRTTRLVTKTLLAKLGINTFPLFSFENYYNNNVTRYFEQVGVFGNYYEIKGDIDFTDWLEYFTDGIIDELNRVKAQLPQSRNQERLEPHHKLILEYIKENGSISAKEYAQLTDRARPTRIGDFKKLVVMGLIMPVGVGKATYYVLKRDG
ncbi:MAG TPA: Fic family protein [Acidimicrobiia bacterium]|nr:Fic family protein [Acidimicrobiia bacterium]